MISMLYLQYTYMSTFHWMLLLALYELNISFRVELLTIYADLGSLLVFMAKDKISDLSNPRSKAAHFFFLHESR